MLHVCSDLSAAGCLRQTLKALNRNERVISFGDNLAMGPISDVGGLERKAWFLSFFNMEDGSQLAFWESCNAFWDRARDAANSGLTVWLSRRCTREVAWFSQLMAILPSETKFDLIDFTNEFPPGPGESGSFTRAIGLGVLNPKRLERGFEISTRVAVRDFSADIEQWKILQAENAPLRVFRNMQLVSAAVDYFDATLLKYATENWQSAARVVGASLVDDEIQPGTIEVGDSWLFDRLWNLIESGRLEANDEILGPRAGVRLKT